MRRRMSFSVVIGIVLLSLLLMLLAACGGQPATPAPTEAAAQPTEAAATEAAAAPTEAAATEAPAASGAPVEITFWSWVPHVEDQVNEFNASQSAIKVNYVNPGGGGGETGEYAKLKVALEAQSGIPDVVQIEFQHLPSYIVRDELLNLVDYGANDIKDLFVPWTWAQVSSGGGVYAYPQDAGPMILMCNQELLDKYEITAPTTWDEFAAAADKMHKADANVYLTNFTADAGHFFGLLWQSGARPFVIDGQNITINFTSPEVTRVAKLWGDLIKSGNLSPVDTYTSDWNTALGNGSVACWASGAWGPALVESAAPDFKGKWKVYLMPQWTAGGKINGNYGGSTIAVMKATTHPKEAEAFNRWLNTDPKPIMELTLPSSAALFPVTQSTLSNPEWTDFKADYWSGDEIHKIMAEGAQQVDVSFAWSPFQDFVYSTYTDELNDVKAGNITFEQAMQNLQDKVTAYATDQGFAVK